MTDFILFPLKDGKNGIKKTKYISPHLKSSVIMSKKHRNKGNQKVPPIISYRKGIDEIELIEKQREGVMRGAVGLILVGR